jgi:hypothetical protein
MEQQYPQLAQPQPQPQPQQNNNFLMAIPVTNVDEANAFRVDPQGTPTLFYNAGKNEVYLKRTNTQTGLADFLIFSKIEKSPVEEKPAPSANIYKKDFEAINDKIDGLYSLLSTVSQQSEQVSDKVSEQVSVQVSKGAKNVK